MSEGAAMIWATEKPTTPGFYWWRRPPFRHLVYIYQSRQAPPYLAIAVFDRDNDITRDLLSDPAWDGEWWGPLEIPR